MNERIQPWFDAQAVAEYPGLRRLHRRVANPADTLALLRGTQWPGRRHGRAARGDEMGLPSGPVRPQAVAASSGARRIRAAAIRRPPVTKRKSACRGCRGVQQGAVLTRVANHSRSAARVGSSSGTTRSVSSLPSGTLIQVPWRGRSHKQSSSRSTNSPMRIPVPRCWLTSQGPGGEAASLIDESAVVGSVQCCAAVATGRASGSRPSSRRRSCSLRLGSAKAPFGDRHPSGAL